MKTFSDEVVSAVDGKRVRAKIAQCEACGCMIFGAWQIDGQDHFHLQCIECNTSYCPQGRCEDKAAGAPHHL